jgi:hypothetical protein
MGQMAGLASIAIEGVILFLFNPSAYTLAVIVAPIAEESMKATMFLLFLYYRRSLGVHTSDRQMVFAALWIGASFGFYEWSAKELATLTNTFPSLPLTIFTIASLGNRMILHGGVTIWIGITNWLARNTRWSKLAVIPGLLIAILLHAAHNHLVYQPQLGLLTYIPFWIGDITIVVVGILYIIALKRSSESEEN